jgi:hypothetical protein
MRRLQEAVIETEHSFEPKSDGLLETEEGGNPQCLALAARRS